MCLAVPGKIIQIYKEHADVDVMGIRQKVNILLLESPEPGDYILVHAGFAIEKIDSSYYGFLWDNLYKMMEVNEELE